MAPRILRVVVVASAVGAVALAPPAQADPNPNPPDPGSYLYGLRWIGITTNQLDDQTALDTGWWLCGQTGYGKGPILATTLQARFPWLRRNQAEAWVTDSDWICPNSYLHFPTGSFCPGHTSGPPPFPGQDCYQQDRKP